jgi:hypothetical protein
MDINSQLQGMLGTAPTASITSGASPAANSVLALSSIATNGSLLAQGISKLTQTLETVLTELGAP